MDRVMVTYKYVWWYDNTRRNLGVGGDHHRIHRVVGFQGKSNETGNSPFSFPSGINNEYFRTADGKIKERKKKRSYDDQFFWSNSVDPGSEYVRNLYNRGHMAEHAYNLAIDTHTEGTFLVMTIFRLVSNVTAFLQWLWLG